MNSRRFFLSLALAGTGAVFLGCASSSNNQETLEIDKKYKELEKKEKILKDIEKHYKYQYSVLGYIKKCFNYSLKIMEKTNFETKIEEKYPIDITFTFPYWFGPNITLTKDQYFVRKFAGDDLLFFNFGIGSRLENMYRYRKDLFGDQDPNEYIKKFFNKNSLKDFFVSIYYKVTSFNEIDLFLWLKNLNKFQLINIDELLQLEKIERVNFNFIKYFYDRYLQYEYELDPKNYKNLLKEIPLKEWKFSIDGQNIYFTKEDYIPYVFSLMIMERLILSVKKQKPSILRSLNQIIIP